MKKVVNGMRNKKTTEEHNTYDILGRNYHWKWLKNKSLSYYEYVQTILSDINRIYIITTI